MSEAINPSNNQDLPEQPSSSPAWYMDWDDFSAIVDNDPKLPNSPPEPEAENWNDWQTVNFPNAISVDAIERQALYSDAPAQTDWAVQAAPTPSVDLPAWAQPGTELTDLPDVADLISLIQELNQCNSALIDRVSQLEEALDRNQGSLSDQRQAQDQPAVPTDLAAAQDQIRQLLNQLETSYQSNQRQQIMIETLTQQLESSQERVAQLEREYTLIQQRHNEQVHWLTQSENSCRDLRIRLQRQQRYTLQYKAALEKCLDVTSAGQGTYGEADNSVITELQPWFESSHALVPQPFLPKVQQIQPWSAQTQPLAGKLGALVHMHQGVQVASIGQGSEGDNVEESDRSRAAIAPFASVASLSPAPGVERPIQLASLPSMVDAVVDKGVDRGDAAAVPASPTSPGSALEHSLNEAVQPLPPLSSAAIQAGLAELQSALGGILTNHPGMTAADVDATLWQDLARLIDISADDVLKASMAGDFSGFEATSTDGDATAETPVPPSAQPDTTAIAPSSARPLQEPKFPPISLLGREGTASKAGVAAGSNPPPLNSSSPSPLIYPTRPPKKLASLAAVDLPTFPR